MSVSDQQLIATSHDKYHELPQNQSSRVKNCKLKRDRAYDKKIRACDKTPFKITHTDDKHNYVINLNTETFCVLRNNLVGLLHFSRGENPGNSVSESRHFSYIPEFDEDHNLVSKIIRIRNLAAVTKHTLKAPDSLIGGCAVTVNLYTTVDKCLINGKDAEPFVGLLQPAINKILRDFKVEIKPRNQTL